MKRSIIATTIFTTAWALPLYAQDEPKISLELNRTMAASEGGCQVVFYGKNGLDRDFKEVTFLLAVMDNNGVFQNLLALPLGALTSGKRRVVQYTLPAPCDTMSEIIVSDISKCVLQDAPGTKDQVCLSELVVSNRTEIAFGL